MDKKAEKEMLEKMQAESRIAAEGTELERLALLEGVVDEMSEGLRAVRQQVEAIGSALTRARQAITLQRIVALKAQEKSEDSNRG